MKPNWTVDEQQIRLDSGVHEVIRRDNILVLAIDVASKYAGIDAVCDDHETIVQLFAYEGTLGVVEGNNKPTTITLDVGWEDCWEAPMLDGGRYSFRVAMWRREERND